MARLRDGEKSEKKEQMRRLLASHEQGLREADIAEELGWDRRTVNNYLRELKDEDQAYKEGRSWFFENWFRW